MAHLLAAGTVLRSRYKVTDLVGEGGMGAVYRAEDLLLEGRFCALKEIHPELGYDTIGMEQARQQFYREASILARLDHPYLPKVSDFFSEDDREYLVMDFVPGKDLRQVLDDALAQGTLPTEAQVLKWAAQLCDALDYLHNLESPVLHRDIKPGNIKLTPAGNIKLVDFGLVKLLVPDDCRTVTVLQGRGTVQYTPLEQYGGDTGHTDVRSDIYSLGGTLYHLLTGRPPMDAKQRFLQPYAMPSLRQLNPAISTHVEKVVLRALAMHPDDRPPSVAAFRQELLGDSVGEPARQVLGGWSMRSWLSTQWLPLFLLGLLFFISLLVTAFGPL